MPKLDGRLEIYMEKIMRIGIMGTLRGGGYVRIFKNLEGAKVTAVCDFTPRSIETIKDVLDSDPDIAVFDNFDDFIECGRFDAAMLCNYFLHSSPQNLNFHLQTKMLHFRR